MITVNLYSKKPLEEVYSFEKKIYLNYLPRTLEFIDLGEEGTHQIECVCHKPSLYQENKINIYCVMSESNGF